MISERIKVKIITIGRLPESWRGDFLRNWKSDAFELIGGLESFALKGNADLDGWAYSDENLRKQLPKPGAEDFLIAIVNIPLQDNFYARRVREGCAIFTCYQIDEILAEKDIPLSNAVLRMLYSYCLAYKRSGERLPSLEEHISFAHDESRGCLFDMNGIKSELALSCDSPIICEDCKCAMRKDSVSNEFIELISREARKIVKPAYFKIRAFIEKRPITSIAISLAAAFLVNLASSYAYDALKH